MSEDPTVPPPKPKPESETPLEDELRRSPAIPPSPRLPRIIRRDENSATEQREERSTLSPPSIRASDPEIFRHADPWVGGLVRRFEDSVEVITHRVLEMHERTAAQISGGLTQLGGRLIALEANLEFVLQQGASNQQQLAHAMVQLDRFGDDNKRQDRQLREIANQLEAGFQERAQKQHDMNNRFTVVIEEIRSGLDTHKERITASVEGCTKRLDELTERVARLEKAAADDPK